MAMTNEETRVGHTKADSTDVYVGRGQSGRHMLSVSKPGKRGWLGNPYPLDDGYTRAESIAKFREAFEDKLDRDDEFRAAVALLHGQVLGCWCQRLDDNSPACHAEIIAEHADCLAGEEELVTDGGEPGLLRRSSEREIASEQLDSLRENSGRCAQVSKHAGEHPYVRWNNNINAYEIATVVGTGVVEVETCTKDALLTLFAENPVNMLPLSKATYSPPEPGTNNIWKATMVRDDRDDIIYTEDHQ